MNGTAPRSRAPVPTPSAAARGDRAASPAQGSRPGTPSSHLDARVAAPPNPTRHRLAQVNLRPPPVPAAVRPLELAGVHDSMEIEADRAVAKALGSAGRDAQDAPPSSLTSRSDASARRGAPPAPGPLAPALAADMAARLQAAAAEAEPLPAALRREHEALLGHDFADVTVHRGPASAAAARRVGARAFTLGRAVYFGENAYAPDTDGGRRLVAHELMHTTQDRPNRIARRALGPADAGDGAASLVDEPGDPAEVLAGEVVAGLAEGDAAASAAAFDTLAGLHPEARLRVLARLRSRFAPERRHALDATTEGALGTRERPVGPAAPAGVSSTTAARVGDGSVTATPLAPTTPGEARVETAATGPVGADSDRGGGGDPGTDAAPEAASTSARRSGVVMRTPGTPPAPAVGPPGSGPVQAVAPRAPSRAGLPAAATAAARLREATRSVGDRAVDEPASGSEGTSPAEQAPGVDDATDGAGRAAAAAAAMRATIAAQSAQLTIVASRPVRFLPGADELSGPSAVGRGAERTADAFVADVASRVRGVLARAAGIPGQVLASLGVGDGSIREATARHSAALAAAARQSHDRVRRQAAQASAAVASEQRRNEAAARDAAEMAAIRGHAAYERARGGIAEQADREQGRIDASFAGAEAPLKQVGQNASREVSRTAHDRKLAYEREKNGESSLLDGPYHDDQCDARAEAAEKVGEEYGKSFRQSAIDQAARLPEGKPAVTESIAQVVKQLDDGLRTQQRQVNDAVDAFSNGAAAQSRRVAAGIGHQIAAGAAESDRAIDGLAVESAATLERRAAAECRSLDEAAAATLTAVGAGVARAAGELTSSVGTFAATAAGMPPPSEADLSGALDDARGQVHADTSAMDAQLDAVAPHAATLLTDAAGGSATALEAAAGAARAALDGTAARFGATAATLRRDAAAGFRTLAKGNDKTANDIAGSVEDGFDAAQASAAESFGLFGGKVDETFADGRRQMFDSLWSDKNRADLDRDIGKYADEAAAQVKPRWKRVLKWVITIVVLIAVVAITIVSAGALGPVGVILLGAALGAAAGAVTTIADNLLDGRHWSDGVAKAMIAGAIGGAVGGAAGLAVKGVGSVAVKFVLEQGINIAGGVAGEAIGSLAVGEAIDWHGALMGALTGAAIGAGLHIAGALKGRVRLSGLGDAPAVKPRPPTVEPPRPAGRIRGALERSRILAPRAGAAVPAIEGSLGTRAVAVDSGAVGGPHPVDTAVPGRSNPTPSARPSSKPATGEALSSAAANRAEPTARVDAKSSATGSEISAPPGSRDAPLPRSSTAPPEARAATATKGVSPERPPSLAKAASSGASPAGAGPEGPVGRPPEPGRMPKGTSNPDVGPTPPEPSAPSADPGAPARRGPLIVDLQSGPMTGRGGERSFLRQRVGEVPDARGIAVEPGDYRLGYEGVQPTGPRDLRFARMLMHRLPEFPGPADLAEAAAAGRPGEWPAHRFDPAARFPQTGDVRMLQNPAAPGMTPTPAEFFPPVSRSGRVVPTDLRDVAGLRPTSHPELHGQVSEAYWRRPFGLGTADAPTVEALGKELDAILRPGGFAEFRVLPSGDARVARQVQQHMPGSRVVEVPQRAIRQYAETDFATRPAGLTDEQWGMLQAARSDIAGSHDPLGRGLFNRIVRIYKGTGAAPASAGHASEP
jgi:Domain of unknown function (DUF4157)